MKIFQTAFYTSLISYAVFFAAEILRPGFVSRSFSVHLILLAAIAFGVAWAWAFSKRPHLW